MGVNYFFWRHSWEMFLESVLSPSLLLSAKVRELVVFVWPSPSEIFA